MAFQPTSFQINAFQWAVSNQNRSGVARLWLAELTAKLNGMLEEAPKTDEKSVEKPVKLEKVTEQPDGSAIIGEVRKNKKKERKIESTPVVKAAQPDRSKIQKEWTRRNLPLPEETADYLVNHFALQAEHSAWAAGKVVELLKLAAEEAAEDELIIETAASMLL